MRTRNYLLATEKESPSDAELISHQLMIRAGLIRKVAAGIYTWLPTGLRVLKRVEHIIREEMDKTGAVETLMPHLVPAELWEESHRWQKYGGELLRIKDRHQREFCFGPTHEETFVDTARKLLHSYKQLPLNLYQIQTKFRDETRPRFGMMRGREFIMKDAYSFHTSIKCLQKTYDAMHQAYLAIFKRLGLDVRAVEADPGAIGGNITHEFQVLADAGEDLIFYSNQSHYAANIEQASAQAPDLSLRKPPQKNLIRFATPKATTLGDLEKHHQISPQNAVKTLVIRTLKNQFFILILRGDHQLNEVKVGKIPAIGPEFTFAHEAEIVKIFKAHPGSLGPVGIENIPIIVDREAAVLSDFVCGANQDGFHFQGANWDRDVSTYQIHDVRNVVEGDLSPDGKGTLVSARGIEVGHIFQLGTEYSTKMNACVLDETGTSMPCIMGCYGLGVGRVIAAAVEQHHDAQGILWPREMAPFAVVVVPIGYHKSEAVKAQADQLYETLKHQGIEVLLDDRDERPGVMFAEMDLIGIPHRIVISDRLLATQQVEYKARGSETPDLISSDQIIHQLQSFINS